MKYKSTTSDLTGQGNENLQQIDLLVVWRSSRENTPSGVIDRGTLPIIGELSHIYYTATPRTSGSVSAFQTSYLAKGGCSNPKAIYLVANTQECFHGSL